MSDQTQWVKMQDQDSQRELIAKFLGQVTYIEPTGESGTESVWIPHDGDTAFQWTRVISVDSSGPWNLSGVVFYGEITADRLRSIRLTGEQAPRFSASRLQLAREETPSHSQLLQLEQSGVFDRIREADEFFEEIGEAALIEQIGDWRPRGETEALEDFLARVAQTFLALEHSRPNDTTKALAAHANVPFTTAVNWIRQCRDRQLLPKSRRQRARERSNG